jgi:hypothetical protein
MSLIRNIIRHTYPAEGNVHIQVRYPPRHEVVQQMAHQYRKASRRQKTRMLTAFVAVTDYSRKYAVQILNHPEELQPSIQRPRPPHSCPEVQQALFLAWKAVFEHDGFKSAHQLQRNLPIRLHDDTGHLLQNGMQEVGTRVA